MITWGISYGGDSSAVASSLLASAKSSLIICLCCTEGRRLRDHLGDDNYGGDSSAVASSLSSGVSQIFSADAFAALKDDGSVITWGYGITAAIHPLLPLLSPPASAKSSPIDYAFGALKDDGSVITWGMTVMAVIRPLLPLLSSGVSQIFSNDLTPLLH